jgi:hypothetical protein
MAEHSLKGAAQPWDSRGSWAWQLCALGGGWCSQGPWGLPPCQHLGFSGEWLPKKGGGPATALPLAGCVT